MAEETQRWELTWRGRQHRVEAGGSWSRTVRWYVDDELVATENSSDDNVHLAAEPDNGQAVGVKFSTLGAPRRATLFEAEGETPAKARAVLGLGGYDLDPEPGSKAALREQRIREHPWRHTAVATAGGVAKVVVPILLGILAVRFVIEIPWPDWSIPWPDIDLPSIPWPDWSIPWPDIPWPDIDLPDWELPAWVRWVLDKLNYVWPVLIAFALATNEVNRRRKQDALRAKLAEEAQQELADGPSPGPQHPDGERPEEERPEEERPEEERPEEERPEEER